MKKPSNTATMNTRILISAGLVFSFIHCFAQRPDKKTNWDCQYIMHSDSANKILLDKMAGIASIRFDSDSTLNITGVCNTGSAKAVFGKDNTLKISDISKTMLWCDQKNKENEFLKYIIQTTSFEINTTGLKLYLNNKKKYLFFVGR